MEHLEETILALYVLDAPEIRERRAEIAAHLDQCIGCAQLRDEMKEYYDHVGAIQAKEDESMYPALQSSAPIARSPRDPYRAPLPSLSRSAVQGFVRSFKTYPVRWSGGFALVMAALLLLIPKIFVMDKNPAYVHAKDGFVVALNTKGEELWRRYIAPGFVLANGAIEAVPRVVDVDGDGKREIFLISEAGVRGWAGCFNADGSERWRFQFRSKTNFGDQAFSGDYVFEPSLVLRDFGKNGKHVLVLTAHHMSWWPAVVGVLDANDGSAVSEYWHPGWLKTAVMDVDEDGQQEIVALGYNNAFSKNALAVLDPRRADGCAPSTANFTPQGMTRAVEKFYMLLPDPDLFALPSRLPVGNGADLVEGASLEVRTVRYFSTEKLGNRAAEIFFDFDKHMNCVKVRPADDFSNVHHIFEKEGKVMKKLDAKYLEDLRREVLYWDGEKFVKKATMNLKYLSEK